MKLYVVILLFCFSFIGMFAQDRNLDSLKNQLQFERRVGLSNDILDSIHEAFYQKSDSLKNLYKSKFNKLDSSRSRLKIKLDGLTGVYSSTNGRVFGNEIDSVQSRFTRRTDSLKLHFQTSKITHSIDSINNLCDSASANLNQKLQTVKDKTVGKLQELIVPPQLNSKVSKMMGDINGFKIPAFDLNISSPFIGSSSSLGKLDNLNLQTPVQGVGNAGVMENAKGNLNVSGIYEVANKTGDYKKDIQQLTKGNLTEVKELSNAAEAKAERLSGLNEVKDQNQVFDEYKDIAGKMQNPDSLKESPIEKMKQVVVNHFAGKEQVLKEAMETISKYKSKYSSVNSISDMTKWPKNEMHGKPLIERIIPGLGIQVQKKGDDVLADFNPSAGYRFTGRITAGVGWNQRVAYCIGKTNLNSKARMFGPRMYGEARLWKGFSPRAEVEVMNTTIPPITRTTLDPAKREWVWTAFVGIKKEYRFIKDVKGTALVMMRLFNPDHKSPYADVVNVRFGFEFPIKSE